MGAKITSMSFRKRGFGKSSFWSEKETDLFYGWVLKIHFNSNFFLFQKYYNALGKILV